MAGLAPGVLITIVSAVLDGWTKDWWSSALVNIGTTILLAGLLTAYGQKITSAVRDIDERVETVRSDLASTQSDLSNTQIEVRTLRELARDRSDLISRQQTDTYSKLASQSATASDLVEAIELATKQLIIGRLGFRVHLPASYYYVRFAPTMDSDQLRLYASISISSEVKLVAENESGDVANTWRVGRQASLADILGQIHVFITSRGASDYEPTLPIELLATQLQRLSVLQRTSEAGTADWVQELFDGDWYITDRSLWHTRPAYEITAARLDEQNWESHLSEKTWYDVDTGEWALYVARALLSHQNADPFRSF